MLVHSKSSKKIKSILFAFNSYGLLQAFGSIFSVGGNYLNFEYGQGTLLSDVQAIQNDWGVIGKDLQSAVKSYEFHR